MRRCDKINILKKNIHETLQRNSDVLSEYEDKGSLLIENDFKNCNKQVFILRMKDNKIIQFKQYRVTYQF